MLMEMDLEMIFLSMLSSRYVLIWLKIKVLSACKRMRESLVFPLILTLNIRMPVVYQEHLLHRQLLAIHTDA